jgi:hypothetical protein
VNPILLPVLLGAMTRRYPWEASPLGDGSASPPGWWFEEQFRQSEERRAKGRGEAGAEGRASAGCSVTAALPIVLAGAGAALVLVGLGRVLERTPPAPEDPRDVWVRDVVRSCWVRGEYVGETLHVVRTRAGFLVCEGDEAYDAVPRARLVRTLREHWDRQHAQARRELAGGAR